MSSLAVVFDFDDTLVPDSTTRLLRAHGIDPQQFWESLKPLVRAGYDPTLAFLNSFLDLVGDGKPLGRLTNKALGEFGASLNKSFFPGLPGLFKDLKAAAAKSKVEIEFYVISGGLQEVIEGTEPIQKHFTRVYGCQLDEQDGVLRRIKRCITFTEKTRYLFEISKGITPEQARRNPYVVNKDVPEDRRPIPFKNIIYVGDGLTDIPCFSLLMKWPKGAGVAFGVFNPADESSARRAFLEFLKTERVLSMHRPAYRKADELGALLRAAVAARCTGIQVERGQAE